jgi:integration host factor subunit alpha
MSQDAATITRADIAEAVYEQVGLSRVETAALVEQVLDALIDSLKQGDNVKISSFASFNVRQKTQRIGRNPKTGEEVPIEPRKVISFRASHVLKKAVSDARNKSAQD